MSVIFSGALLILRAGFYIPDGQKRNGQFSGDLTCDELPTTCDGDFRTATYVGRPATSFYRFATPFGRVATACGRPATPKTGLRRPFFDLRRLSDDLRRPKLDLRSKKSVCDSFSSSIAGKLLASPARTNLGLIDGIPLGFRSGQNQFEFVSLGK
jgi:hypothetical protein